LLHTSSYADTWPWLFALHCCSGSVDYHACQLQLRVHKECISVVTGFYQISANMFEDEFS